MVDKKFIGYLCFYGDKLFMNVFKFLCDVILINISYFFNIMVSLK